MRRRGHRRIRTSRRRRTSRNRRKVLLGRGGRYITG